MSIFDFIGNIFKPASDIIDEIHVSDEERGVLRNKLAEIQAGVQTKLIDLEGKRLDAMSKVQVAESSSKYMITAIWRPVSSLAMVTIITLASFDLIEKPAAEFYDLAKVFLGAYVGSRGIEKSATAIAKVLGK